MRAFYALATLAFYVVHLVAKSLFQILPGFFISMRLSFSDTYVALFVSWRVCEHQPNTLRFHRPIR